MINYSKQKNIDKMNHKLKDVRIFDINKKLNSNLSNN